MYCVTTCIWGHHATIHGRAIQTRNDPRTCNANTQRFTDVQCKHATIHGHEDIGGVEEEVVAVFLDLLRHHLHVGFGVQV